MSEALGQGQGDLQREEAASPSASALIPNTAHFIWFGSKLPFIYALALRYAALRGGFDRVCLHHDQNLSGDRRLWAHLQKTPGFESRPLSEASFPLDGPLGERLLALYRRLSQPAARANLWRAALLAAEGGVYLDTDTLCLQSFAPLRAASGAFCGEEPVALPATLSGPRSLLGHLRAGGLLALRDLYRRLPGGWAPFRRIEPWYAMAANNAILAARPEHPFILGLLEAMIAVPEERQLVRYALGTHLLQARVAEARAHPTPLDPPARLITYPAPYFYPLGPEISQHWFRAGSAARLDEILAPETHLVHWYASVRTREIVPRLSADFIRANSDQLALCKLALPFL